LAVAAVVAAVVRIDVEVPGLGHLGSALVALTFLYAPVAVAWWRREDLLDYGFRADPVARGLRLALAYALLVVPLFAAAYAGFYHLACAPGSELGQLAPPGACRAWRTGAWGAPEVDWALLQFVAVQLVVVALPEELLFRGCLLELLERRFPPRWRLAGGGLGLALVLSSLAFALVHLPKHGDPRALATFFPGLVFGWMRSATGSILAPVLAHGLSNVLVELLDRMVLR
jgi:hypothetical protein